jgi:hypothetical protein
MNTRIQDQMMEIVKTMNGVGYQVVGIERDHIASSCYGIGKTFIVKILLPDDYDPLKKE